MTNIENQLIQQYKDDFRIKVGRVIDVRILDKWDELCSFDTTCPFWKIVRMILDATGWDGNTTFCAIRRAELISRRQIIDMIAMCNGGKLIRIGRETGRNHTTILNSVRNCKTSIETDLLYRTLVREIIEFIKGNYHLYRDKEITKEDILPD